MFRKINPHPQGKIVKDCAKRAIVFASEINYHDVAIMLNRFRNITKTEHFNSNKNWKAFVEKVLLGRSQGNMQYAKNGSRFTVREYARYCRSKTLLRVAKHLTFANGKGDYIDTWDCGHKSIYNAYVIPSYETIVNNIKTNYKALAKGLSLERYVYETI